MGTHNLCLYKEVDKTESKDYGLVDFALIRVCAVIMSNMVFFYDHWNCLNEAISLRTS